MKKRCVVGFVIVLMGMNVSIEAQMATDTIVQSLRRYVARNFSEVRTFNLYWERNPDHSYALKQNGEKIENGEMKNEHTIKFAMTLPVMLKKNFSLYASGLASFYVFDTFRGADKPGSAIFENNEDNYSYYKGSLSGNYRTRIFNKPLVLAATLFADGWEQKVEKAGAEVSAVMVLKHSAASNFSVGLYGTTLYNQLPVLPIVAYTYQFTPNWSVDVVLPSRTYLRYQFHNNHRLSIGTLMDNEHFYLKSSVNSESKTFFYNKTSIKPEIIYEYIINKHFYLMLQAGGTKVVDAGLFRTNRKGIDGDPYIRLTQPMTPFFYMGFSYNLFK